MNKIKLVIIFFLSLLFFVSCKDSKIFQGSSKHAEQSEHIHDSNTSKTYYTCAMHPNVKQDSPGKCPICHMNLTKVEEDDEEAHSENLSKPSLEPPTEKEIWYCKDYPDVTSDKEDLCPIDQTPMIKKITMSSSQKVIAEIMLKKSQIQHFKAQVFSVTPMKMKQKIRLLGSILQSEEKESNIPARVGGRVDKVYVKSTGSFIKVGDPVLELYSPELITAGEEYLIAKKSYVKNPTNEFKELLMQSEQRLKLWGIKKRQFELWFKNNKIPKNIRIYSPSTGIVQKRNAIKGKYFKEGQNFFELSDLSSIWVEMDVYEQDAALIELGQNLKLKFKALPGEDFVGEIDFVAPVLDEKSRTLKVRTTITNKNGKLKPGMVAEAILEVELEGEPLVVPRSAVIDTGHRKVVWVKKADKKYQAHLIQVGYESEGYVEIKNGLKENEEVVVEGNFLLDAQSQLFGGYEKMNTPSQSHHH